MSLDEFASPGETLADLDLPHLPAPCRERAIISTALLRKAEESLHCGELMQSCLYGWGAAEEITKAVAANWQQYGVVGDRWQDLRALVNALSVVDPDVIRAIENWSSDYDGQGVRQSWPALDDRLKALGWDRRDFLADGFLAANDLLESFRENHATEFIVEHDLKLTERFVTQMRGWLQQPCPPEGFRQFHNR